MSRDGTLPPGVTLSAINRHSSDLDYCVLCQREFTPREPWQDTCPRCAREDAELASSVPEQELVGNSNAVK